MTVKQTIRRKVDKVFGDSNPNIYKGLDYDGTIQAYGWWYRPFGRTSIYLGRSKAEAIETLGQIQASRE